MKKTCFVLILAILLSCVAISSSAASYKYVVFSGNCNVRSGPGLNYKVLGSVPPGSRLDYMGSMSYDDRNVCWYSVYYKNSIGWVSSVYATLFTDDSGTYSDTTPPDEPLTLPYGEWKDVDGDKLAMRVKVTNSARGRTVKAFEIYMYAEDVWHERIYGENIIYYETTIENVYPGETAFSETIDLPNRSHIDRVYAAVNKVVYTDGSIQKMYPLNYYYWDIPR